MWGSDTYSLGKTSTLIIIFPSMGLLPRGKGLDYTTFHHFYSSLCGSLFLSLVVGDFFLLDFRSLSLIVVLQIAVFWCTCEKRGAQHLPTPSSWPFSCSLTLSCIQVHHCVSALCQVMESISDSFLESHFSKTLVE